MAVGSEGSIRMPQAQVRPGLLYTCFTRPALVRFSFLFSSSNRAFPGTRLTFRCAPHNATFDVTSLQLSHVLAKENRHKLIFPGSDHNV
jgi:hypothetical protein